MDNFIRVYDQMLQPEFCKELIEWFEFSSTKGVLHNRSSAPFMARADGLNRQDKQIPIDANRPVWAEQIYNQMAPCVQEYANDFPWLKGLNLISSICIMQATEPLTGDGYHTWHCEKSNYNNSDRVLAWILYLNDIDEGGETEFLYQGIRVAPKEGRLAIWPAGFTHVHRGNPPLKNKKYVISGWMTGDRGIPAFRFPENN